MNKIWDNAPCNKLITSKINSTDWLSSECVWQMTTAGRRKQPKSNCE